MILFTKSDCPNCAYLKGLLTPDSTSNGLQIASLDTDEGLALLALYQGITVAERELPVLVADEEDLSELMVKCEVVTGLDRIVARLLEAGCITLETLAQRPGAECKDGVCKL